MHISNFFFFSKSSILYVASYDIDYMRHTAIFTLTFVNLYFTLNIYNNSLNDGCMVKVERLKYHNQLHHLQNYQKFSYTPLN